MLIPVVFWEHSVDIPAAHSKNWDFTTVLRLTVLLPLTSPAAQQCTVSSWKRTVLSMMVHFFFLQTYGNLKLFRFHSPITKLFQHPSLPTSPCCAPTSKIPARSVGALTVARFSCAATIKMAQRKWLCSWGRVAARRTQWGRRWLGFCRGAREKERNSSVPTAVKW